MYVLIERYKKIPIPVKASFWFVFCSILQKGISLITVPIFTRLLSAEQYGQFNVYQSWLSIVTAFATLNLFWGQFNVGLVKFEKDRDSYISSVQFLTTCITAGVLIIYLLFSDFFNQLMDMPTILVLAMFLEIIVSPALQFWSAKQRFQYKYINLVIITILMSILNPVIGVIAVINVNEKGMARIFSNVFLQICFCGCIYLYNFRKGKCVFSKKYWKFALLFNMPLLPHYLSQSILNQSDRIMISNMVGIDKAGIYSVAYSTAIIMTLINSAINNTMVPWTYEKLKDKCYKDIGSLSNYVLLLIAGMNLLLISFAPEIVMILAPKEYYEAIWVIPPIASSVFFIFLYYIFANIEFYFEENKFIMLASVITAICNIILNYVFINYFGYIAAGYTTLLCYIIYSFSHYFFMKKTVLKHNINENIYNIKFIVILSGIFVATSMIIMFFYQWLIIRYIIIIITILTAIIKKNQILSWYKQLKK